MAIKFFIALAIFSVLMCIEAHEFNHHHKCRKHICQSPKKWSKTAGKCRCLNDVSSCFNWQKFDTDTCSCYCPYSRHFHGCSKDKRWRYSKCYCECRKEKPEGGCGYGNRWSKSQCKCVKDESNNNADLTTKTTITGSQTTFSKVTDITNAAAKDFKSSTSITQASDSTTENTQPDSTATILKATDSTSAATEIIESSTQTTEVSESTTVAFQVNYSEVRNTITTANSTQTQLTDSTTKATEPYFSSSALLGTTEHINSATIATETSTQFSESLTTYSEATDISNTETIKTTAILTDSTTEATQPSYSDVINISSTTTKANENPTQASEVSESTTTHSEGTDITSSVTTNIETVNTAAQLTDSTVAAQFTLSSSAALETTETATPIIEMTISATQITDSTTVSPINDNFSSVTQSSSSNIATQTPLCTYGTAIFNNDTTIKGISAGVSLAFQEIYPAVFEFNGKIVLGSLQSYDSIASGFSFALNNQINAFIFENVTYLTQTPGCNCQFVSKETEVSPDAQLATLNDESIGIGSTSYYNSQYNYSMTAVGAIDIKSGILHYLDIFDYLEATTIDYKKLICIPITTTKKNSVNPSEATILTQSIEQKTVEVENILATVENDYVQLYVIKNTTLEELNALIVGSNTPVDDISTLKTFVDILNEDPTLTLNLPTMRKRQTPTTCQEATNKINLAEFKLKEYEKIKLYLETLLSRLLKKYFGKVHTTLPSNAFESMEQYYAQYNILEDNFNSLGKSLTELKNQKAQLCDSTSTASVTTTLPSPIVTRCDFTKDLFDSKGNYISSVCWLLNGETQDNALTQCKELNMKLFTISSEDERNALFIVSSNQWGYGNGANVWISGKNGPNYVDSNDGTSKLENFAYPTNTDNGGNCISTGSFGVPRYEILTTDCATKKSTFCKWTNPNPEIACYAWTPYLNDSAPKGYGYASTVRKDGAILYLGQGAYGTDMAPGNLQINQPTGLFLVSDGFERFVTIDIWYLLTFPTCECSWTYQNATLNPVGLIRVSNTYFIGRYFGTDGTRTVGKVYSQNNQFVMGYPKNGVEITTNTFEVYQCNANNFFY